MELYIGIMSGTSLDGIDAVLADFSQPAPRPLAQSHLAFDPELRRELAVLCDGTSVNELERSMRAGIALAEQYAEATRRVLASTDVAATDVQAIGCHGQTVRHRPELGFTVQLNNPALLAELTGISVVADFRSRDMAAGGQGAPLVPAFHQAVFQNSQVDRVIVNIGGIANLTYLPRDGNVTGFDCGPGNGLMDAWASHCLGKPYDAGGLWASGGKTLPALLDRLWQTPYFHATPPKSTGRELFNLAWLKQCDVSAYPPQDVQRTLLELTIKGIVHHIAVYCKGAREVFVCGGGAMNATLMRELTLALPGLDVGTTEALGLAVTSVEPMAFAWLAKQALQGKPGNLPAVTGARHPTILGAIYLR